MVTAVLRVEVCASTCSEAGERHRELPHKVIFGSVIMVLHYKAHQGQVRHLQLKAQSAVPSWVEACRGRTRAVNTSPSAAQTNRSKGQERLPQGSVLLYAAIYCFLHLNDN